MKYRQFLLPVLLIIMLFWSSRWILTYHFDALYFNDLFDHSQWRIPFSTRVISDSQLYKVAGWRYLQGNDLFSIAPEVPPFGKYLFGISIRYTNNPYLISILTFFMTLVAFWLTGRALKLKNRELTFSLTLLLSSPLFLGTIRTAELDSFQLLFLTCHALFIIHAVKTKSFWPKVGHFLLAGVSLGSLAAVKFPVYVPLILLVDSYYLFKNKQLRWLLSVVIMTGITYVSTFGPYLVNHSLREFISTQAWMVDFYAHSASGSIPFMASVTTLSCFYKGWWGSGFQCIDSWSIWWPISIMVAVGVMFKSKQLTKNPEQTYILFVTFVLFSLFQVVPFWPRYLIAIFPLWLLLMTPHLKKIKYLGNILIVVGLIQSVLYLFPQPSTQLKTVSQEWREGDYADSYHYFDLYDSPSTFPSHAFASFLKSQLLGNNLTNQEFNLTIDEWVWPWQTQTTATVHFSVDSPAGTWKKTTPINLYKHQGQWKLSWTWEILADTFSPKSEFVLSPRTATQGELISADGVVLSKQAEYPHLILTNSEIPHSQELYQALSKVYDKGSYEIEKYLLVEARGVPEVNLGPLSPLYLDSDLRTVLNYPGIRLISQPSRVYHPSLILEEQIVVVRSIEEANPLLFGRDGGTLELSQPGSDSRILLEREPQPGEDVRLTATSGALLPEANWQEITW